MNKYQIMPPLSEEEFAELKADIAERGVQVPVEYDEDGNVLDGYHRIKACQELGITDWPRIIRTGMTEEQKRLHARKLNLARRHLTQEQKRELLREQLRETPEKSNRQIAASLGVDDKTVGAVRKIMESTAEIPQLDRTVGADGKERPRQVERRLSTSIFLPTVKQEEKAKEIIQAAKQGDERAKELVKAIDAGKTTINKAYNEIREKTEFEQEYAKALEEFPELKDLEPEQAVIAAQQLRTMPPKEQARSREAAKTWHLIKDQPPPAEVVYNSPFQVLGRIFDSLDSCKRKIDALDPPLLERIAALSEWEFGFYAERLKTILPSIDLLREGFVKREKGGNQQDESSRSPKTVNI